MYETSDSTVFKLDVFTTDAQIGAEEFSLPF